MKHLPHLLTFPRSGSHYLDEIIYKKEKISIEKSHAVNELFDKNNNKQRTVITIARDPVDTISSYITLSEKNFGPADSTRINQIITEYVLMYGFLCDNADYIIDFKDLTEHPDAVVNKVISLLDIKKEDYKMFNRHYNEKHERYVESSKTLSGYKRHNLEEFNLGMCYFYYNKLLAKRVVI